MLSQKLVFHKSKNFTSDNQILMPPTIPFNHYIESFPNQQNPPGRASSPDLSTLLFPPPRGFFRTLCLFPLSHANSIHYFFLVCFEHSNLLKVNGLVFYPTPLLSSPPSPPATLPRPEHPGFREQPVRRRAPSQISPRRNLGLIQAPGPNLLVKF